MSDLLGPLLGMSPFLGYAGAPQGVAQAVTWTGDTAALGLCCLSCGQPLLIDQQRAAEQLSGVQAVFWQPPEPEPGIHWEKTRGKSWRVRIVR